MSREARLPIPATPQRRRTDRVAMADGGDDPDNLRAARGLIASVLLGGGIWALILSALWLIAR